MNFWELENQPPENVAIIAQNGNEHTYSSLLNLVHEQEVQLYKFPKRTLGFILCDNRLVDIVLYLACIRTHQVLLLLDSQISGEQLKNLQDIYQPHWIANNGVITLQKNVKDAQLHTDLSLLLSTSGSTGSPKLVRLTRSSLQANADSIVMYLNINENERAITSLPMSYAYGLSIINSHLLKGATLVLNTDSVLSREFIERMHKQRVTSFAGVPYMYQMLYRTAFFKQDLPSLKTLTQAGGYLEDKLQRFVANYAQEKGLHFFVMYGQTEACARISYVPTNTIINKIGSIGVPVPNGKLELNPTSGELIYYGSNVMLGYAETREDLALGDQYKGCLATGDIARQDEEGFYYITGRIKRFIKVGGHRIGLDEVEQALQSHLEVSIAASGKDDYLIIWLESSDESLVEYAHDYIRQQYAIHPTMTKLVLVEHLPLLTSGKKDYLALMGKSL
ncbi:AMP-binding protein [Acinetobacter sp. WCHA45]|uniref:AMP-binding protein n=1 Tax=Acinetobacter sp. WCHA45 TaxID=2004644 RepID=UPI000B3C2CF7|nr:AMP-binding protein [Acinetobacter sp. WCHA45]AVZ84745.1 phosphatase [Acinetobacter sp. WCHA45]